MFGFVGDGSGSIEDSCSLKNFVKSTLPETYTDQEVTILYPRDIMDQDYGGSYRQVARIAKLQHALKLYFIDFCMLDQRVRALFIKKDQPKGWSFYGAGDEARCLGL